MGDLEPGENVKAVEGWRSRRVVIVRARIRAVGVILGRVRAIERKL